MKLPVGEYDAIGVALREIVDEIGDVRRFEVRRDMAGWHVVGFSWDDMRIISVRKVVPTARRWKVREVE